MSSYRIRMGPKSNMTDLPIKRGEFGHRDRHMQPDIGVMHPGAKKSQDLPTTTTSYKEVRVAPAALERACCSY